MLTTFKQNVTQFEINSFILISDEDSDGQEARSATPPRETGGQTRGGAATNRDSVARLSSAEQASAIADRIRSRRPKSKRVNRARLQSSDEEEPAQPEPTEQNRSTSAQGTKCNTNTGRAAN